MARMNITLGDLKDIENVSDGGDRVTAVFTLKPAVPAGHRWKAHFEDAIKKGSFDEATKTFRDVPRFRPSLREGRGGPTRTVELVIADVPPDLVAPDSALLKMVEAWIVAANDGENAEQEAAEQRQAEAERKAESKAEMKERLLAEMRARFKQS
jgi:hypothetical protein